MPDSEFTPTVDQAKRAYVTGMRQAFIGSAGEHEEEFARFLAARDASVRAAALDEAAEVAEAFEARKSDEPICQDCAHTAGESVASAIRALKEETK